MKGIDVNAIPSAEELQSMFVDGARTGIAELERQYRSARAGELDWSDALGCMRGIAHDIKGQGGSFGFPLITEVGNSLSVLLKHDRLLSEPGMELLGVHLTALSTILEKTIQGDGGELGARYSERLSEMVRAL